MESFKESGEGSTGPLVTIITPSYGQGRFIEETILSVKGQEYPHIEHIIVDGGSKDETLDVLRRHEGTYNMRWVSEPDGGMYEAVNKGLRMARGDILAYLNSDDRYFPWTVRVAVNALLEHPNVDFVFGDLLNVDDETAYVKAYFFPPFRLGYMRRFGFLGQAAVFWRRVVYEQCGGFDESLKHIADCEYWMRIGERHRAHKINEVMALERDHPEAKRLAQEKEVYGELETVRARYGRRNGFRFRVQSLLDHAYMSFWYRWWVLSFLFNYLFPRKTSRLRSNPGWAHIIRSRAVGFSWVHGLLTLVPRAPYRFRRGMMRFNKDELLKSVSHS